MHKKYPDFMNKDCNIVKLDISETDGSGILFEAADGSQTVFWDFPKRGSVGEHSHDFDEYCVVIQGTMTEIVGGKKILMKAGDELMVPAGVPHSGEWSDNYRALDVFGGRRFEYKNK